MDQRKVKRNQIQSKEEEPGLKEANEEGTLSTKVKCMDDFIFFQPIQITWVAILSPP